MKRCAFRVSVLAAAMALPLSAGAAGTGHLFVSSEKDAAIQVLDGKTHEVIKEIGTAARPRHMIFDAKQEKIYVACGDGDAIDVIDVASLSLVDRITGIDDPEIIELSPDGNTLYISLEDDGELGMLNLTEYFEGREEAPDLTVAEADPQGSSYDEYDDDDDDDEEEEGDDDDDDDDEGVAGLSTIEVGLEPEGILVTPEGDTVYVTSEVANMVHVVDTEAGELTENILVGNRPRRFALSPDGSQLWVSNELGASVSIIDTESNQVAEELSFLPPGFRPEDVTPVGVAMTDDGSQAVVALGRANHVAFVNTSSMEIEDYVLVGTRAWNLALSKDQKTLYVVNGLSDDITLIDMETRKATKSIPTGRVPHTLLIDE